MDVYLPEEGERTGGGDCTQAPVAFARVGAGRVGYVGDVDDESETGALVLRMCGLGV